MRDSRKNVFFVSLTALYLVLTGCATTGYGTTTGHVDEDTGTDQWEKMNRGLYTIHKTYDKFLLKPIATGYYVVTPEPVRRSVTNFFLNIRSPVYIINDLLQGKPKQAFRDTARFVINSTLGFGGIWDPAAISAGLPKNTEDFGQTLAVWGLNSGPYLFVPGLGPATVRDGFGILVDVVTVGPILNILDSNVRDKAIALFYVNTRANLLKLDETIEASADPYVFIREAFLQHREFEIYDGEPPEEDFEEFEDFDDEPD